MGVASLRLQNYSAAELALSRSRELCAHAYGTHYNLAVLHVEQDRPEAAVEDLKRARALRPALLNGAHLQALAFAELARFEDAMAAIDEVGAADQTVEPWHDAYQRGYVEALRCVDLYGKGFLAKSKDAEKRSIAHYERAFGMAAPGSSARRRIAENARSLAIHRLGPVQRCELLLRRLNGQPKSRLFTEAFVHSFETSDFAIPARWRREFASILRAQNARPESHVDEASTHRSKPKKASRTKK